MIATHRKIFAKLQAVLPAGITGLDLDPNTVRFVKTSDAEAVVIKDSDVVVATHCLPSRPSCIVAHEGKHVLVLPGPTCSPVPIGGATPVDDIDWGVATVAFSLDEYQPLPDSALGYALADAVFGKGINGAINGSLIAPSFGHVHQYVLSDDAFSKPNRTTILRVFGLEICATKQELSLQFSPALLALFRDLLISDASLFVGEAVFRALTATHWEHAFLEMYRAIENLFAVPYVERLRERMRGVAHGELAAWVESSLTWRPKDLTALTALLGDADEADARQIHDLLGDPLEVTARPAEPAANRTYLLRNRIAHGSVARRVISPSDWDALMCAMARVALKLYRIHGLVLFSPSVPGVSPCHVRAIRALVVARAEHLYAARSAEHDHRHFWYSAREELGLDPKFHV